MKNNWFLKKVQNSSVEETNSAGKKGDFLGKKMNLNLTLYMKINLK